MKMIGLTGGIASGKSSVSLILAEHGLTIIDLDIIARQALAPGTYAFRKVVELFGPSVLSGGAIHRKRLGDVVFNDRAARQRLNQLLQPWIALRLLWALVYQFSLGTAVVVIDAPLLFETGLHRLCSVVVVVSVDRQTQLQRLMARDGAGEVDAKARIAAQPLSLEDKAARADVVVDNRGGPHETRRTVVRLLPSLRRCSMAQRALRGPLLLLLLALLRLGTGRTALSPLWWGHAAVAVGWAALLLGAPALLLGPERETCVAGVKWLLLSALLSVLMPWWLVLAVLVAAPLLLAFHAAMRPRVLGAREEEEEEDLGEGAHVLFAGSLNPMHSGHVALLARAARRHPRATIFACVAYNPSKQYTVSPTERRELAACMLAAAGLADRVHAVVVPQYPWRFGLRRGVAIMYRGVRTWQKDGAAESILAALNIMGPLLLEATLPPDIRYMEASPELRDVSSTSVRKRAERGQSLDGLVPKGTEARVAELYGGVLLSR